MSPGAADLKFERLTNLLLLLLETSRPLTLDEITSEIPGYPSGKEARRQAFERDKAALRSEGIPVTVERIPGGSENDLGYRVRPSEYYLDLDLAPDETVAVRVALAAVQLDLPSGADPAVKLGDVDVDTPPPLAALPAIDHLPTLNEANRVRATVEFDYRGTPRQVDPYGLLFRSGFWYVIGHDHGSGETRTFRVDRIDGPVSASSPGSFDVPAGFDPAAALPDDPLLIGGDDVVEARVLVDGGHAARVVQQLGADQVVERRADGSAVLRLDVANRAAFRSWLFGLLDHAEVVAPPDLRAEVVEWLEAVAGGSPAATSGGRS